MGLFKTKPNKQLQRIESRLEQVEENIRGLALKQMKMYSELEAQKNKTEQYANYVKATVRSLGLGDPLIEGGDKNAI